MMIMRWANLIPFLEFVLENMGRSKQIINRKVSGNRGRFELMVEN